ncbi:c-type cytochrome domain-containing protein, partial [Schlesneria sp.]|uniref:c-type cytochrome domain-containing protein n=1 Tax=Schlesneria sp. TaxID=2762018 RepID=UPI002F0171D6
MPVKLTSTCIASLLLSCLALAVINLGWSDLATGDDNPEKPSAVDSHEEALFRDQVQPLLQKYCYRCHDAETMKSGVRVDHLTGGVEARQIPFWLAIRKLIDDQEMPPAD